MRLRTLYRLYCLGQESQAATCIQLYTDTGYMLGEDRSQAHQYMHLDIHFSCVLPRARRYPYEVYTNSVGIWVKGRGAPPPCPLPGPLRSLPRPLASQTPFWCEPALFLIGHCFFSLGASGSG